MAVVWGGGAVLGLRVSFDKDNAPTMIIKHLVPGNLIKEVVFQVTTPFDALFTVSLGFPADHDAIAADGLANLQLAGEYKFYPYRVSAISETLTLYFTNTSTGGAAKLFVEQD